SKDTDKLLKMASETAEQYNLKKILPELFLLAAIEDGNNAAYSIMEKKSSTEIIKFNLDIILDKLGERSGENTLSKNTNMLPLDENLQNILNAVAEEFKNGDFKTETEIGPEHVVYGMTTYPSSETYSLLLGLEITAAFVKQQIISGSAKKPVKKVDKTLLNTFGRELVALAKEGKLDIISGRDAEIERMCEI